jgi:hypothetical protein
MLKTLPPYPVFTPRSSYGFMTARKLVIEIHETIQALRLRITWPNLHRAGTRAILALGETVASVTIHSTEPFVSASKAAKFLDISPRFLLSLARKGIAGAYALDGQAKRKVWRFLLSELAGAIRAKRSDPQNPERAL